MNVYDFDHTIYAGDSTVDFYLYCVRKHPRVLCALPVQVMAVLRYLLKRCDKTQMKQGFYAFLRYANVNTGFLDAFWKDHADRLQVWYLQQHQKNDLIISASPEFLLRPICQRLGVRLIASGVEMQSGQCTTPNCRGVEKVYRFRREYPGEKVERFYSDGSSDEALAQISDYAFLVRDSKIMPWPERSKQRRQS